MADQHPPHQQHPIPPTSPAMSAIPSAFSSPARSSSHHDQSSMMMGVGASTSSRPTTTGGGGGAPAPLPPPPRRHAPPPLNLSTPLAPSRTHPHQYQHTHTQQHLHPPSSTTTAARLSSSMKGAPSPMRAPPIVTPTSSPADDKNVLLQIHYGTRIILRGPKGATLTAKSTINTNPMLGGGGGGEGMAEPTTPTTPSSIMQTGTTTTTTPGGGEQAQQAGGVFKVCTEGRGLGEPSESFMLINCNKRDDKGPIAYNNVVAIRCRWANERFLGANKEKGLGIWRTLIGSDEKWVVRRPDVIIESRRGLQAGGGGGGGGGGTSSIPGTPSSVSSSTSSFASSTIPHTHTTNNNHKHTSAPGWVHAGDPIILQSLSKEHAGRVLIIRESPHVEGGSEVILCPPESAVLAQATWLMGWAGTPLYPAWNVTRPYLTSCEFLLHPHRHNLTAVQEEAFEVLSHSANRDEGRYAPRPLCECAPVEQERLLVEDLLWVVYGYEGKYIKAQSMGSNGGGIDESTPPSPLSPAPPSSSSSSISPNSTTQHQQDSLSFHLPSPSLSSLDPSLASMVQKFLPLGQQALLIRRFVDTKRRYDYGVVAQALAAALQDLLLKPYTLLLAQLEHKLLTKGLTLQQLFFHLQPSFHTLASLSTLCTKVHRLKGGALLNCIRDMGTGGDEKHTQIHAYLLDKAAAPYMLMLEGWIYQGQLDDPYHEFMVREELSLAKENVQEDFNAAYWDARSTVRKEHVLGVLGEWEGQILTTGKYLNVIRECGQDIGADAAAGPAGGTSGANTITHTHTQHHQQQRLRYGAGKAALGEAIDAAYRRACRLLLDVVLRQHRLLPRLTSIKHYFLLDTGDFFVHFMNNAERELLKDMGEISPSRLEGLLHLSIQMSVASNDPYKDDVTSVLNPMKLIEHLNAIHTSATNNTHTHTATPSDGYAHGLSLSSSALDTSISFAHTHTHTHTPSSSSSNLPELPSLLDHLNLSQTEGSINGTNTHTHSNGTKAYEALMLDCQVKWPLCLVISRRTLTKYQLLFRHLFLTKFVERRLHTSWAEQQSMKELDVRGALGLAFVVRQKMQHFMENYIYYMMFEVIEPHWLVLCEALKTGEGVEHLDDVIRLHHEFQDSCLKECLLTTPGLLKVLNKIVTVCVLFAAYMEQAMREFETGWYVDEEKERRGVGSDGESSSIPIPATDDTHTHNGKKKGGSKSAGGGGAAGGSHDSGAARRQRVARQTDSVQRRAKLGAFTQNMEAFAKNLDFHLQEFMCGIWKDSKTQSNAHLNNLIQRLDYSGYFRAQFEGKSGGVGGGGVGGGNGGTRMIME